MTNIMENSELLSLWLWTEESGPCIKDIESTEGDWEFHLLII